MLEKNIKNLIKILEESKVDQLEVSTFWGKQKIKISKNVKDHLSQNIEIVKPLNTDETSQKETISIIPKDQIIDPNDLSEIKPVELNENTVSIKAPLVGTFYKSSKPGDPPFINVGDEINKGDTICIIEAMKIFNEIEAESSGKVIEILISDGTPVEYDQPLILISPK